MHAHVITNYMLLEIPCSYWPTHSAESFSEPDIWSSHKHHKYLIFPIRFLYTSRISYSGLWILKLAFTNIIRIGGSWISYQSTSSHSHCVRQKRHWMIQGILYFDVPTVSNDKDKLYITGFIKQGFVTFLKLNSVFSF